MSSKEQALIWRLARQKSPPTEHTLFEIIESENAQLLSLLLEQGFSANCENHRGETPLYLAIKKQNPALVEVLLNSEANLEATTPWTGQTPLHEAVLQGNLEVVQVLVHHECPLNSLNSEGLTPLALAKNKELKEVISFLINQGGLTAHDAVQKGDIDFLTDFIEAFPSLVNATDHKENSLVHAAVQGGQYQMLKWLIQHQARINISNYDDITPLHLACRAGHLKLAQLLLESGADVNASYSLYHASTYFNCSPLHSAIIGHNLDMVKLLLQHRADLKGNKETYHLSPLYLAIREAQSHLVDYLIQQGSDFNQADNEGLTAMDIAMSFEHPDVLKVLQKHGAEVSPATAAAKGLLDKITQFLDHDPELLKQEFNGACLIHIAAKAGQTPMVQLLIERGSKINRLASGWEYNASAPLFLAVQQGHLETAQLLLTHKAKVNMTGGSYEKITPIFCAVQQQNLEMVQLLIDYKADINHKCGGYGINKSPLYRAAEFNHTEMVQLLLNHKADPNTKGGWMKDTPLHLAVESNNKEMVELLLAHRAKTNIKDTNRETPITWAIRSGNQDIINLLR